VRRWLAGHGWLGLGVGLGWVGVVLALVWMSISAARLSNHSPTTPPPTTHTRPHRSIACRCSRRS
jgi:hypothetical protein